jgi:hypothetical protein
MTKKHLDKEDRLEKHYRRLGTHEPICTGCAETDPRCMEDHHLAGQKYHDDTGQICRNCHRKLSDDQFDHAPRDQAEPVGQLAVIGRYLLGLCDLLAMAIATLRDFAEYLINEARCAEVTS